MSQKLGLTLPKEAARLGDLGKWVIRPKFPTAEIPMGLRPSMRSYGLGVKCTQLLKAANTNHFPVSSPKIVNPSTLGRSVRAFWVVYFPPTPLRWTLGQHSKTGLRSFASKLRSPITFPDFNHQNPCAPSRSLVRMGYFQRFGVWAPRILTKRLKPSIVTGGGALHAP